MADEDTDAAEKKAKNKIGSIGDAVQASGSAILYRISTGESINLLLWAGFFDVLSFVPGVNLFVVIIGQVAMRMFFFLAGISTFTRRMAIMYIAGWVIEAIPIISFLPAFLFETVMIIGWAAAEDVLMHEAEKRVGSKMAKQFVERAVRMKQRKMLGQRLEGKENADKIKERFMKQKDGSPSASMKEKDKAFDKERMGRGNLRQGESYVPGLGMKKQYMPKDIADLKRRGKYLNDQPGGLVRKGALDAAFSGVGEPAKTGTTDDTGERSRTRNERRLSPAEAAQANPSATSYREEVTDYGNQSPAQRKKAADDSRRAA